MDDIKSLEAAMYKDVDEYVQLIDDFETALTERTHKWQLRVVHAERAKNAKSRMTSLIISAVIILAALLLTYKAFS